MADLEFSTFQNRPAYRYIRESDGLPRLHPEESEAVARVKLFTPDGGWTWWISAYDPETRTAFGLVRGLELEYGYIDMAEVVALRGGLGLPVERDLHWTPKPLREIQESESSRR